jgi:hypothetical protein
MHTDDADKLVSLGMDQPIWDQFFTVAPLVIVGSKEANGFNLAPKHLAMPLGWESYYCFVCSPQHTSYHNIRRHGVFTVSYLRPTEVLLASLAAAPRCEDLSKPALQVLPTVRARQVDGVLVPALVFHEVERLDMVKMVRVLAPLEISRIAKTAFPDDEKPPISQLCAVSHSERSSPPANPPVYRGCVAS